MRTEDVTSYVTLNDERVSLTHELVDSIYIFIYMSATGRRLEKMTETLNVSHHPDHPAIRNKYQRT